jgi:hypothetical protein
LGSFLLAWAPAAQPVAVFTGGLGAVCEGPARSSEEQPYFTGTPSVNSVGNKTLFITATKTLCVLETNKAGRCWRAAFVFSFEVN